MGVKLGLILRGEQGTEENIWT